MKNRWTTAQNFALLNMCFTAPFTVEAARNRLPDDFNRTDSAIEKHLRELVTGFAGVRAEQINDVRKLFTSAIYANRNKKAPVEEKQLELTPKPLTNNEITNVITNLCEALNTVIDTQNEIIAAVKSLSDQVRFFNTPVVNKTNGFHPVNGGPVDHG